MDVGEVWIRKAAERGHGGALVELARLYAGADFVPRDPSAVETLLLRAAEMKIADAQYQIARMYRLGYLRSPEYARAIEWFEEAAEKEYAPAHVALAEMCAKGEGTPVDLPRSARLYLRAAELGYAPALVKTADNYRYGRGVAPDPITAAMWLMIAAQKGIGDAQPALNALEKELKPAQVSSARKKADAWIAANPEAVAQPAQGFNYRRMMAVPTDSPADRPPSTPEERERAVRLVAELESNFLGPEADASREWLDTWMAEVPDLFFHSCPLLEREKDEVFPHHLYLIKQAYYAGGACLIQHPEKINDQLTIYIAGVEGALRAYNNLVAKQPTKRNGSMEFLLKTQAAGQLETLVHQRVRERCR
jgi:TPR repeat protein